MVRCMYGVHSSVITRAHRRGCDVVCSHDVNAEKSAKALNRAKLRDSTTVLLVGNIELTMEWYRKLGFDSEYYPPGFAILRPVSFVLRITG